MNKFQDIIAGDTPVLVDFFAEWCGPCKMLGEVLLELEDLNILKVNVDEYPEIARRFGIMSIPTLIIFEDGKEVAKNIGFMSKEALTEFLKNTKLKLNDEVKTIFTENNIPVPNYSMSFYDLLKRPEINLEFLSKLTDINYSDAAKEQVEISTKYEGYIAKTYKEVEKMLKLESKEIPADLDYDKVVNLASEARQKLKKVAPKTIAQAMRISGVNPADISILSIYLRKEYNRND